MTANINSNRRQLNQQQHRLQQKGVRTIDTHLSRCLDNKRHLSRGMIPAVLGRTPTPLIGGSRLTPTQYPPIKPVDLSVLWLISANETNFRRSRIWPSPPPTPPPFQEVFVDIVDFLNQYYLPAIIALGLVGNLLSCVVFLNTHLRLRSSSYYLAALASVDFCFLVSLVLVWISSMHGVQVFNRWGWCQVVTYVSSVCAFLSSWLIVAFTVERFIAVQYPLHRPHMCTVARAKLIVSILAAFALLTHSYTLVTRGMVQGDDGFEHCEMVDDYRDTMRIINVVDTFLTLVIPMVLIIVMNAMITRNLVLFGRRFKQEAAAAGGSIGAPSIASASGGGGGGGGPDGAIGAPQPETRSTWADAHPLTPQETASSSSTSNNNNRRPTSRTAVHLSDNCIAVANNSGTGSLQGDREPSGGGASGSVPSGAGVTVYANKRRMLNGRPTATTQAVHLRSSGRTVVSTRTQQSITKMLLLISTAFIVLNLPSYGMRLYASIADALFTTSNDDSKLGAPPISSPYFWFWQQVAMNLYYTNFSINFLLYSMCGVNFRRCLWQLMRASARTVACCSCYSWRSWYAR